MFGIGRLAAVAMAATVLTAGMLGSIALAAFAPSASPAGSSLENGVTNTTAQTPKAGGLKAILDGLVSKGVITQAQEDAILAAAQDARPGNGALLKHVVMGLLHDSADYLGLGPGDLRQKLPGTSLGALANATPGKSRDGLVAALTDDANTAIAKALSEGKITQAQADKLTAAAPERIAKFVDRIWPKRS